MRDVPRGSVAPSPLPKHCSAGSVPGIGIAELSFPSAGQELEGLGIKGGRIGTEMGLFHPIFIGQVNTKSPIKGVLEGGLRSEWHPWVQPGFVAKGTSD